MQIISWLATVDFHASAGAVQKATRLKTKIINSN